jgi:hypothetical protein
VVWCCRLLVPSWDELRKWATAIAEASAYDDVEVRATNQHGCSQPRVYVSRVPGGLKPCEVT